MTCYSTILLNKAIAEKNRSTSHFLKSGDPRAIIIGVCLLFYFNLVIYCEFMYRERYYNKVQAKQMIKNGDICIH